MLEPRRVQPVPWQRPTLAEGKRATRFVTSRWATQCQHQWVAAMMLCGYGAGHFASNACISTPYQFKQHMDYFHCFEIHFLIYFVTVWAHTRAKVSNIWISTAVFFVGGLKQGIGKFARCKLQKKFRSSSCCSAGRLPLAEVKLAKKWGPKASQHMFAERRSGLGHFYDVG